MSSLKIFVLFFEIFLISHKTSAHHDGPHGHVDLPTAAPTLFPEDGQLIKFYEQTKCAGDLHESVLKYQCQNLPPYVTAWNELSFDANGKCVHLFEAPDCQGTPSAAFGADSHERCRNIHIANKHKPMSYIKCDNGATHIKIKG